MFVMDCYGHKLYNGVLFAHHLILDVPGGSSSDRGRRREPPTTADARRGPGYIPASLCAVYSSRTEHSTYCILSLYCYISHTIFADLRASVLDCAPSLCAPRLALEGYALLFTSKYAQACPAHPVAFATGDRYRFGSACQAHSGSPNEPTALAALPEDSPICSGDAAPVATVRGTGFSIW